MKAFLYSFILQWKLDIRDKGVFITYYAIPLAFFLIMGNIFSSVLPNAKETLIPSMTIFGITMGTVVGSPIVLVDVYGSEIKKSYQVGHIPLSNVIIVNFLSAFIHSLIFGLIVYIVGPLIFDVYRADNTLLYFLQLTIYIISGLSIGGALGVLVKKTSQLTMIGQIVFLPSIMLSGIMFPSSMLPPFLQTVGKIFPATWCYQMMSEGIISLEMLFPVILICIICLIICVIQLKRIKRC
ncbi:MAG: ABC transporter permease, partial [Coprobacillus sp.]